MGEFNTFSSKKLILKAYRKINETIDLDYTVNLLYIIYL